MKKYYKLLATAWMAIRPLFPCFAANTDKIQWEFISNYFNFSTITEEEKRTNLETNIRLLVEEQLKLPSGQNLWKAFRFWEEQHQGLAFRFKFSLTSSSGASVVLKNMEKPSNGKQVFCFEIAINEVFAESFFAEFNEDYFTDIDNSKNFLNINMLYRPCLIKLVDPDDPDNWEYHLREQKLPFFITLAHEFLHALNQLERIDQYWDLDLADKYDQNSNILTILKSKISMQNFLANKLNLKNEVGILSDKYLKLWGDKENDDSLDEMTVILGSERKIGENNFVFIGETTFLQEYYNDNTIISWSHYSTEELEFWQKMSIILKQNYVQQVLTLFDFDQNNIQYFQVDEGQIIEEKYYFYQGNTTKRKKLQKYLQNELNTVQSPIKAVMMWENIRNSFSKGKFQKISCIRFWEFIMYPLNDRSIRLLPKYTEIQKGHNSYDLLKKPFSGSSKEKIHFIEL